MNCAKSGCYSFVGRDDLNGFCGEHKVEAVMHGVEVVLHELDEQKKQIDKLDYEVRTLN